MNRLTALILAIAICALFLLSGCGILKPKIITKEVPVPIPVPCVKVEDIPEDRKRETDTLKKGDTPFRKVQALTIDNKGLDADNGVMRALLLGCKFED